MLKNEVNVLSKRFHLNGRTEDFVKRLKIKNHRTRLRDSLCLWKD